MELSIREAIRSDLALISNLARELNIIHHKARPDIYADVTSKREVMMNPLDGIY